MTLSGGSAFCAKAGADAAARATADKTAEPTWRQRGFGFIVRCVEFGGLSSNVVPGPEAVKRRLWEEANDSSAMTFNIID